MATEVNIAEMNSTPEIYVWVRTLLEIAVLFVGLVILQGYLILVDSSVAPLMLFLTRVYLLSFSSHFLPSHPVMHLHVNSCPLLKHVPPFSHGFGSHTPVPGRLNKFHKKIRTKYSSCF